MQFISETEKDSKLPFIDVLIYRVDKHFKFIIYRKPTNNDSYIHYYSSHPLNVKKSVFSSMFLRALRICSPQFLQEEIEKIYEIANKQKYPRHVTEKAFHTAKRTFHQTRRPTPPKRDNVLLLPYHENFTNIPQICKHFNINTVFSNTNNVKKMLIKNSPSTSGACIYKI